MTHGGMGRAILQSCPSRGQEVLARAGNVLVARAAYDMAVSIWGAAEIELRQGSRVICSSHRN